MKTSFQLIALPHQQFETLFIKSDTELRAIGVRRVVIDESPGFPCRISLADAAVGETVLLLPFTHHDVSSPYRASGPIFIRKDARTAEPGVDEIPMMFRHRLHSIRGYDAAATLTAAAVSKGSELEESIGRLIADVNVSYLHIHNAGPGCYNCWAKRA